MEGLPPIKPTLFRQLLSNVWLITSIGLVITASSIVVDFLHSEPGWTWFQRSGAILVLVGVILGLREIIRLGLEEVFQKRVRLSHLSGGFVRPGEKEQEEQDKTAQRIGVSFTVIGTLIWAYGDLIGRLF